MKNTEPRSLLIDKNLAALARLEASAIEQYEVAVRATRHGNTPAKRAAALERAQQLRPLIHPGRTF
jgi:hypothetical protein